MASQNRLCLAEAGFAANEMTEIKQQDRLFGGLAV